MNYKYAFRLYDNARAFIESAVEYARLNRPEQWTFAIVHLTTSLELILKARLALEDPQHLARDAKTVITEKQFDEGEFFSVGIDESIERLDRICKISLTKRQRTAIKTLQNLRNRTVHYINPTSNELKIAIASGINLFIDINNTEFSDHDPSYAKTMSQLIVELREYDEFVKERFNSISEQLRSSSRPRTHYTDECSVCSQDATIIDGDNIRCLFCGHSHNIEEYAGSDEVCPECGRMSVEKHENKGSESTYECFCCGYFRGPEIKWSNWGNNECIPRLHPPNR